MHACMHACKQTTYMQSYTHTHIVALIEACPAVSHDSFSNVHKTGTPKHISDLGLGMSSTRSGIGMLIYRSHMLSLQGTSEPSIAEERNMELSLPSRAIQETTSERNKAMCVKLHKERNLWTKRATTAIPLSRAASSLSTLVRDKRYSCCDVPPEHPVQGPSLDLSSF